MRFLVYLLLFAPPGAPEAGVPFSGETLNYSVNWPSGLSLGEGRLTSRHTANHWNFELSVEAAVPGFAVSDHFRSRAAGEFCSSEFEKETAHGKRKAKEKITFDPKRMVAERVTQGGGKTEISISDCARDALAFLFYTRRELSQGRVPAQQTILFGSPYQIRLEYTGPQVVAANERREQSDRVVAWFKGPASDLSFEVFFARDAARTPLVIRVPLALGTFSMELVR